MSTNSRKLFGQNKFIDSKETIMKLMKPSIYTYKVLRAMLQYKHQCRKSTCFSLIKNVHSQQEGGRKKKIKKKICKVRNDMNRNGRQWHESEKLKNLSLNGTADGNLINIHWYENGIVHVLSHGHEPLSALHLLDWITICKATAQWTGHKSQLEKYYGRMHSSCVACTVETCAFIKLFWGFLFACFC